MRSPDQKGKTVTTTEPAADRIRPKHRKTRRAAVALIALGLALTGCSALSSGEITRKTYEEGHWGSIIICRTTGKVTNCFPQPVYDDPDWRFELREGEKTGWVHVTEDTFNAYEVGDYFEEQK